VTGPASLMPPETTVTFREWLYNGEGACKQMPVCDTLYDNPPPRPESAPPSPPPIRMRPHKIPGHMSGTTCEHIMRQTQSGR
jgi:hypothetical protein